MVVYTAFGKQHPGIEIAERLEKVVIFDPQSYEAYTCRGVALGLRGNLQEALTELERALHLNAASEDEIHPLLWRIETFGLTHQLIMSNLAEVAQ